MRALMIAALLLVAACAPKPSLAPDLPLADRFQMVAFGTHNGRNYEDLWRWSWPIRVQVIGDRTYATEVASHLALLGELTGLHTEMDATWRPNMVIEFSGGVTQSWCRLDLQRGGTRFSSQIYISTDLPDWEISLCIRQEMTQSLGLLNDLDGRTDTNFTSYGRVSELTAADRQLLSILYDDRLHDGMARDHVLAILPEIVDDVKAAQDLR